MAHEIRATGQVPCPIVCEGAKAAVPAHLLAVIRSAAWKANVQLRDHYATVFMSRRSIPISLAEQLAVNNLVVVPVRSGGFVLVGNPFHRPGIHRVITRPQQRWIDIGISDVRVAIFIARRPVRIAVVNDIIKKAFTTVDVIILDYSAVAGCDARNPGAAIHIIEVKVS